jgi:hypothetical protein
VSVAELLTGLTAQDANGQESGDGKVSSTEDLPLLTGLNLGYTINLHLPLKPQRDQIGGIVPESLKDQD